MTESAIVNYNGLPGEGTGSHPKTKRKKLYYPFDRFEIVVELTEDGRFVGIQEVSIRKDFRSLAQKLASSTGGHDVDEFYKE
jgi:hypothetical protein